ncbi:hypothetical protein BCR32DRAFT_271770 [Anaeromyces robustus]|uniref:OB domain-containing protein n=1 Tax=Anaeromyces robustus TaxID=1754192 RepID=A0A1Y1WRC2_9FUNG|nr:hypothetical protein BCR32DRAFT_271770 [Anaeromyces robustus]|eukprot:ORX75674.1 hypothetical protein BCR32DRAFT_271770 [Anaeromyces robustus]
MLKSINNDSFNLETEEYEELKTHRMLFIHDLLSPKVTILKNDEQQIFQIGNPKFNFQFIRILGVIIKIENDTLWIDDSSGSISIKLPKNGLFSEKFDLIQLGSQLEVLGRLREHNNSNNKRERYIEGESFNIKNDPIYEILRPLEIIKLYKESYFSGIHKPTKVTSILLEDDDINDINLSTYPGSINNKKRKFKEDSEKESKDDDSDNYSDYGNSLLDFSDINIESIFNENENGILELLKKYPDGLSSNEIQKKLNNIPNQELSQSLQNYILNVKLTEFL